MGLKQGDDQQGHDIDDLDHGVDGRAEDGPAGIADKPSWLFFWFR
jgi:hypothetical protein